MANEAYGQCSSCGLDYPVSKLRRHPRFGWQCVNVPHECWDGGPHHDEVEPPLHPYEGVRKTTAPLTNTLTEGV
jgi:hypothetical protein